MTTQTSAFGYETAETIAPGWERHRAFVERSATPVREWLLRELAPQPGQTLLELAAGVGDTGFEAAALVGDRGRLLSTDFSPAMVEAARRRGAERSVQNVDYRVIDAERIDLPDDAVDGVICRFGYMLMGDAAAALAETRRVLRPGGRAVLAVWGPPERNPFFAMLARPMVEAGHMPPPDPQAPGLFSLAAPERLRAMLEGAGLRDARIEEVPVRFEVGDAEEHVAIASDTAGALAMVLRSLTDDDRARLVARVGEALAPFAADGGYALPGVALAAAATR
jgi:precorrin-6B methylase 2